MATKKKETKEKTPNLDMLFKKVDDLGERIEILEIDIKGMAREIMGLDKNLISRIKDRMGL